MAGGWATISRLVTALKAHPFRTASWTSAFFLALDSFGRFQTIQTVWLWVDGQMTALLGPDWLQGDAFVWLSRAVFVAITFYMLWSIGRSTQSADTGSNQRDVEARIQLLQPLAEALHEALIEQHRLDVRSRMPLAEHELAKYEEALAELSKGPSIAHGPKGQDPLSHHLKGLEATVASLEQQVGYQYQGPTLTARPALPDRVTAPPGKLDRVPRYEFDPERHPEYLQDHKLVIDNLRQRVRNLRGQIDSYGKTGYAPNPADRIRTWVTQLKDSSDSSR